MNKITLIAAIGRNRELGKDNQLIWKIPEDLKFFKENTIGKYVVMGMNTFNSLPRVLTDRKYIVITSKNIDLGEDVLVFHTISDLLSYIGNIVGEVMIIGGASIYRQMIEYADKMLLTEIDCEGVADAFFPEFLVEEWDRAVISEHQYNDICYNHVSYTRKRVR